MSYALIGDWHKKATSIRNACRALGVSRQCGVNVPMSAVVQSHRRAAQGAGHSPCRGTGKGCNAAMCGEDECQPTVGR